MYILISVKLNRSLFMSFYKHWKKIALALTSAFWASCSSDNGSSAECLYGAPTCDADDEECNGRLQPIQSDTMYQAIALYGVAPIIDQSSNSITSSDPCEGENCASPESSSSVEPASSASEPDEKIACTEATLLRTGPSEPCIEDICPEYGVPLYEISGLKCEDGKEYELESICPDYGIDLPCTNTYIGEDGKRLSEEEFKEIYRMAKPEGESSSSTGPEIVPLYGVEMPAENQDIN